MKITDAFWEKRNLGVSTVEIEIEDNDAPDEINECLSNVSAEYIVLKIPSGRSEMNFLISSFGYTYVEDMLQVAHNLETIKRNPIQQRIYDSVTVDAMTEKDVWELFDKIREGMFETDRISIDPFFSKEMSAERYIGWLKDEVSRGAELMKYIYKERAVGFFALKQLSEGVYSSFLGGTYRENQKGGIGTVVKVPEIIKARGGKKEITRVSSNNTGQVRIMEMNGYYIEKIHHVFVKHS